MVESHLLQRHTCQEEPPCRSKLTLGATDFDQSSAATAQTTLLPVRHLAVIDRGMTARRIALSLDIARVSTAMYSNAAFSFGPHSMYSLVVNGSVASSMVRGINKRHHGRSPLEGQAS